MEKLFEEVTGETVYNLFEEGGAVKRYGISVRNDKHHAEIHDITSVYSLAYEIYETLIRNMVSPLHTKCIITDMIS